ncbi:MAG TPA: tetratricopeptide repeat protein [Caulobacteraceae bacterium]
MSRFPFSRAGAVVVFGLALAGGAAAQTAFDDTLPANSARRLDNLEKVVRELRAIVFQGRETGQPVVIQPADTQSQISALADRVNDLDRTLSGMTGQLEVSRHDLDQARSNNNDLNARLAALKEEVDGLEQKVQAMSAPPPPPPTPAPEAAPPAEDAAGAFASARALLLAGDNAAAEAAFRGFSERFGGDPRDAEAHYYLGKTLLARQAWPEAATADIGAIRGWPQTRWAPDAVLDLARALASMGKTDDACRTLGELERRYPKAPTTVLRDARSLRAKAACG